MSCDKLVFDLSQEIEGSPQVFVKKDWLNILDNQNQNYNSNQSVLDTSQLANSNKYMSYREAYLSMPLLLTLVGPAGAAASGFSPAADATTADYAMGLKSWFGQMIHSFTLDMQGTTIIQQTPYINMWNSFKLLTSMSLGDIATQGPTIGFYPDDPLAWGAYMTAVGVDGQGVCNNRTAPTTLPSVTGSTNLNQYGYGAGNIGITRRTQYINYDPAGTPGDVAYSTFLSAVSCNQVWKSYISNAINGVNNGQRGVLQISVVATIYLKHIHSFFSMTPLLKGVFMKMTMNLNNCSTTFTKTATTGVLTLVSVQNGVLTLQGERSEEESEQGLHFHRVERFHGSFSRSFTLPPSVDPNQVKAGFNNGILTISLAKLAGSESVAQQVPVE
jgi:hypothetical protein